MGGHIRAFYDRLIAGKLLQMTDRAASSLGSDALLGTNQLSPYLQSQLVQETITSMNTMFPSLPFETIRDVAYQNHFQSDAIYAALKVSLIFTHIYCSGP